MKTFDRNHTRANLEIAKQPPASPVDIDRLNDFWEARAQQLNHK
jgi:hypothetical protein